MNILYNNAFQVIAHYNRATGCSAAIFNLSGEIIHIQEGKKQKTACEFCKEHFHKLMPADLKAGPRGKTVCFCKKTHQEALAKSRQLDEVHIYACALGFVYWTSPLYKNGRYIGALTAGQVLLSPREKAVEKFQKLIKDKAAVKKFLMLAAGKLEKSQGEILAMARLLGVCAKDIYERKGFSSEPLELGFMKQKPGSENPLEKERMLFAAFQRGDTGEGKRILSELIDSIHTANPHNFDLIRFRAIELTVLLSRAAIIHEGRDSDELLESNNRNLRQIQTAKTREELIKNLHFAAESMAGKIFSFQGKRHASVLRKAQRYIWENYTRKISLEEISKASGLSAPYFSSIFKEEMGENFSNYLNRLRVEKAMTLLTETGKPLNVIAELCGFQDQSWFSKTFKNHIGVSPEKYRKTGSLALKLPGENFELFGGRRQVQTGRKFIKHENKCDTA